MVAGFGGVVVFWGSRGSCGRRGVAVAAQRVHFVCVYVFVFCFCFGSWARYLGLGTQA